MNSSEASNKITPREEQENTNAIAEVTDHQSFLMKAIQDCANMSALDEVSIIENVTTFLEANAGTTIDQSVLRKMAEALTKSLTDTSPGALQDVTMDNAYGVGYRSPCVSMQHYHGASSPAVQGRSVREFEEHTAQLRKENFNLKLRLYFVEQNMPALKSNGGDGCDTVMRELIDHKVEVEMLRRELEEKQGVLKDALQAIEDLENMQKETETMYEAKLDDLKQKIQLQEMDRNAEKSDNELLNTMLGRSDIVTEHVNTLQKIRELEAQVKTHEETVSELQNKVDFFDSLLEKREKTIQEFEDKTKSLEYQNAELQEELDICKKQIASNEPVQLEIQKYRSEIADKNCQIDELEGERYELRQKIDRATHTIESLKQSTKMLQMEVKKLRSDQEEASKEASSLEHLATAVNNKHTNTEPKILTSTMSSSNTAVEEPLQRSFSEREYIDAIERNAQLERKVQVLVHRLGEERENEMLVTKLRQAVRDARAEAENAVKFRLECAKTCSVLTERLEELAGFLNYLLKNKDVLSFLDADRKRGMRKAINRSLDLSKSLNRTLSITGVSISEYSISQLCNLSEILNNDDSILVQLDETTASGAGNYEANRCAIETLRAENKALKKELDKRLRQEAAKKDRRSLPAPIAIAPLENQSESEAWSEPDRKVSLARIGLEDHSVSLNISKELSATGGKKAATTDSESEIDDADTEQLNHSRSAKVRAQQQETITQLERLIAQRDERILQIQCQLVDVDNRLKKENLRVLDLTDEVRQLRERNEQLQTDLLAIGADENLKDNSELTRNESIWLHQIEEQSQLLERIEKERDRLDDEARSAIQQVRQLTTQLEDERTKHAGELHETKIKEHLHLEETRKAMNAIMQQELEEQKQQQKKTLAQLNELQRQYIEAQRNIDSHIENAKELRQTLVESELNSRALKKQLDESALQATQAVMERSKALSEKLQLEQKLNDCKTMLKDMQFERDLLEKRVQETEAALQNSKAILLKKNETAQLNGSDISQSGYTSEEVAPLTRVNVTVGASETNAVENSNGIQRLNNSSPDLGIESDAGRVSSVELANMHRSLLRKIEVPSSAAKTNSANEDDKQQLLRTEDLDIENRPPNANAAAATTTTTTASAVIGGSGVITIHDCAKVEEENAELKRKLIRTKRQFEETYQKLKIQNQRKAQIEKDIKTQIIKTHHVLKNVRSNMDSEK